MNNYEFFINCFIPNGHIFIFSLLISIVLYIPIIRYSIKSILDPLFYAILSAIFANSIPIFLFLIDSISPSKLGYIILCEGIFWITYFGFAKKNIRFSRYEMKENNIGDYCFISFFGFFVLSNLMTYIKFGIPIFNESRLETYASGGGWGILSHINSFSLFYCTVYSFYCISKNKYRLFSYIVFISVIIFSLLSGAKSSILVILFSYYFYKYYYRKQTINIRKHLPWLFVIGCFPIVLLCVQLNTTPDIALLSFLRRFVANGDIYWMALPNDVVDEIDINNKVTYLFSRILTPFRLMSHNDVELPIGVQIDWIVVPGNTGTITGPNTRLPILCWVLYRWAGLLLASAFGFICSVWRTWLPRIFPRGIIPVIIYGYIYNGLCAMFGDPLYGTSFFFSIIVFLCILYTLYIFYGGRYIKLKNVNG